MSGIPNCYLVEPSSLDFQLTETLRCDLTGCMNNFLQTKSHPIGGLVLFSNKSSKK